jgi:phage terminase small subunit
MAKSDPEKLTFRQEQFAIEYLKDRDATNAARRAGYAESSAGNAGHANLNNPVIKSKIRELSGMTDPKRAVADHDFVLTELRKVAEQEDVAQSTKVRALELLAKINGMMEERISLKTDGLSGEQRAERVAILLERARVRD